MESVTMNQQLKFFKKEKQIKKRNVMVGTKLLKG